MKQIRERLKEITGLTLQNIADRMGVSRQQVDLMLKSNSITNMAGLAWFMTDFIDHVIAALHNQIEELEGFKYEMYQLVQNKAIENKAKKEVPHN